MRWKRARRSDNVVDARGSGRGMPIGGKGLSLGGIAVVVVVGLLLGQDPLQILGQLAGQATQSHSPSPPRGAEPDEQSEFVRAILGDTEDTWREIFQGAQRQYQDPTLVLFSGGVNSACGFANSAVGPFYCPGDRRVYIDLAFFRELEQRFGAAGDFAQAYVIAHEVGHHIQNLEGTLDRAQSAQARAGTVGGNQIQVGVELQADCYAGVWAANARTAQGQPILEPGDVEEGMRAAEAIGDDMLQKQSQGVVVPESFTHGSSAQRMQALRTGLETGNPASCKFNR